MHSHQISKMLAKCPDLLSLADPCVYPDQNQLFFRLDSLFPDNLSTVSATSTRANIKTFSALSALVISFISPGNSPGLFNSNFESLMIEFVISRSSGFSFILQKR